MKVSELITSLQQYDPSLEVTCLDNEWLNYEPITKVDKVQAKVEYIHNRYYNGNYYSNEKGTSVDIIVIS